MIRNYFKATFRHLVRHKTNFFFRLGGLTLALFSILIIALFVSFQLSFDRYHSDFQNIYRVNTERKENGRQEKYAVAPHVLGAALHNQFPEITAYTRLDFSNASYLKQGEKIVRGHVLAADTSFFNVFTFRFIRGGTTSLRTPESIVLTESFALKMFGKADPVGKIVTINNEKQLYQVTGLVKDIPPNSHFSADAFTRIRQADQFAVNDISSPVDFVDNSTILFVKFDAKADVPSFVRKIDGLLDQYVTSKVRLEHGFQISLQPLKDIYLDPALKYEFTKKGSVLYLYMFTILGFFLFVVACINYVNLSVADYSTRIKEIGIRKVMGARKTQVAIQVILDTSAYCILSLVISLMLLFILFPHVAERLEPNLEFQMLAGKSLILFVGLLVLMLIVLSTVFPAYRLVFNHSFSDLKGSNKSGYHSLLGKTLLISQFMISVICITATIIVGRQIKYIHHNDLGIERENLVVMTLPEDFSVAKMQTLKEELRSVAGVERVSNSSFRMGGGYWKDWYTVEIDGEMKSLELYEVFSDDELFATLGMKLLDGRTFHANTPADSGAAFVVNETAARELGLKEPVGTRIYTHPEDSGKWDGTIVGVVADINISSLHQKVKPLVMRLPWQKDYPEYFVYVRINGPTTQTLQAIVKKFQAISPGYPLEYYFVDEFYNNQYQKENQAFASLQVVSAIIVLVSALGVFSLSVYFSGQRMKEFGIRKVLGASVSQITFMHVAHFLRLALIGNAFALPVAYWMMKEWLDGFAYRTDVPVSVFFLVLIITLLLVIISSGHSAYVAGRSNPVDAIKSS